MLKFAVAIQLYVVERHSVAGLVVTDKREFAVARYVNPVNVACDLNSVAEIVTGVLGLQGVFAPSFGFDPPNGTSP